MAALVGMSGRRQAFADGFQLAARLLATPLSADDRTTITRALVSGNSFGEVSDAQAARIFDVLRLATL